MLRDDLINGSSIGLSVSPRKLNLVAQMIGKMPLPKAISYLEFCPRQNVAKMIKTCLLSVIANAENNFGFDVEYLRIKNISVGTSYLRRKMVPRAKGRGVTITKRKSNLYISLIYDAVR